MFDLTPYTECLWHTHPDTAAQIIQHESGGRPYAINVNALPGQARPTYPQPQTRAAAITLAAHFIGLGYSVDMGLMQINSRNLTRYGVSIDTIFDPCTNIRTGSHILFDAYQRSSRTTADAHTALLKALSIYNTGNMQRGFTNGYVARYTGLRSPTSRAGGDPHQTTTIDIGDLYDDGY